MFWIDLIFAVVLAVVLSSILSMGIGWRHPARTGSTEASSMFLFFILLFALWASGVWLPAWGPLYHGRPWLLLLFVGGLISFLVLAIATPPRRRPRTRKEAIKEEAEKAEEAAEIGAVFGLFFWILIGGLLIATLARYL